MTSSVILPVWLPVHLQASCLSREARNRKPAGQHGEQDAQGGAALLEGDPKELHKDRSSEKGTH